MIDIPRLVTPILKHLFLSLSIISTASIAAGFDGIASNEQEFLPVEEAYQVLLEITDQDVVMNWTLAPDYYLYQNQFKLDASNGHSSETLELQFEPGKRKFDVYFGKELETYYYNTLVRGTLPSLSPPYELKVTSQGCADAGLCYPPRKQYFWVDAAGRILEYQNSQLNASSTPTTNTSTSLAPAQMSSDSPGFFVAVVLALFGGVILNLMPCVFPVLSLKALSFANSNQPGHQQHVHGWAYTAGVVGSFLVAAVIIIITRQAGEMLGWGFQLQQPTFVAALVYLFLIMGLSLFGMFNVGTRFMGVGQQLTTGSTTKASFFTGVLAAVVASPCSAPFMATALGAALTQPAPLALIIFACLGLGMALPFLALSYSPALAKLLPKPGPWMEVLKQALAFPLLATSIWLLWVLGHQTGSTGTAYVLTGGLLICFTLWLSRFHPASGPTKCVLYGLMLLSVLAAAHLTWHVQDFTVTAARDKHLGWEPYTPEKLATLRAAGEPVFVNLTADWCITCKVNEQMAFSSSEFFSRAEELGVSLLVGDWTNPNSDIANLIKHHNRSGIPLYLVYPAIPNAPPQILPQLLTSSTIVNALDDAVAQKD